MKNTLKNLMLILAIIAITAAFSGCGRKSGDEIEKLENSEIEGKNGNATSTSEKNTGDSATSTDETAGDTATTTDEINTSDWKTYRNEEYGFELRYPKKYSIRKEDYSTHFSESEGECAKDINFSEIDYNEKMNFIEKYACLALSIDSFKIPYDTNSLDDLLAKKYIHLALKNERREINGREVIISEYFLENGDPFAISAVILGNNNYYYEIKMGHQYFFVTEELKNKFYNFLNNFKIL